MVRCYLLCVLSFLLCCACGLVWAEPIKYTMNHSGMLVVCFPPSEAVLLDNGTPDCVVPKVVKTQEPQENHAVVRQQEGPQMEENKPRDAGPETVRESHPDRHQPTNGGNTNSKGSGANEGNDISANASQSSPETSSNTSPSQEATVHQTTQESKDTPNKQIPAATSGERSNDPSGGDAASPNTSSTPGDGSSSAPARNGQLDGAAPQPSSPSSTNSDTVSSGSSDTANTENGTTSAESESTSNQNDGGNADTTTTSNTTTTTTLPPELTNNKKGDADSSSSISSSVWMSASLLIVVTLACILVC
ncbi:uncharacterized protein TM35_000721190 [Trypanosoma theileri]|uniref:Mucin-associated surface protein (MASP) n=1 Tax=Trypanosoma theileri TaxID=67003 RepID=A0A1X0NFB7_9TRYP|nr:uncharacterized protein TM35_000721190 [Trypanosoma theileri]ORC83416.1 hypothetical protein TM35_000721190 [Trypanosoma theileri]